METETRGNGKSQGAESGKKIRGAGGKGELAGWVGSDKGAKEEEAFNDPDAAESGGKQTGGETKAKVESFTGTPSPTRGRDESAMGGEESRDGQSAERIERSIAAGALTKVCRATAPGALLSARWQAERLPYNIAGTSAIGMFSAR